MIDGTYNIKAKSPIGMQEGSFVFKTEGDALTGTANLMGSDATIENGAVDGDDFTFKLSQMDTPAGPMDFDVKGTVDGNDISGKIKCVMMTLKFSGGRA
ncbi:MAG: hypothetical protein ACOYIK_02520 [Coriobacteriales bacterium]|jgi:hypothetical protein